MHARRLALVAAAGAVAAATVAARSAARRRTRRGAPTPSVSTTRLARTTQLAKAGASAGATTVAHRARRTVATPAKRAELDAAHELRTAEQVTETLGQMKGVLMKLGQMASFLHDGVPESVRGALAALQADAPPMSADLAAGVIERELGGPPDRVFAEWDDAPLAAASIGQVHRAVTRDGQPVAVKVQYPGVDAAIAADLDNTALLTSMLGLIFTGLDVAPFVTEIRQRVGEELDYTLEARRQHRFARLYEGHPAIVIPRVHDALSTRHVLTTDLSAGDRFEATDTWPQEARDLAGETIYRFVFRSLNRHRLFNGDPHPGNYLFEQAGPLGVRVTFLDFGLVKEFTADEMRTFHTMIRHQVIDHDPDAYRAAVERAGLLRLGAPYTTAEIIDFFGYFYRPVVEDRPFTYTTEFAREALRRTFDPNGPHTEVMKWLNLPPAFVVLNRIQWGLNAVLASLDATANWRRIAEELWPFTDGPPSTPLGEAEARWLAGRAADVA